MPTEHRTTLNVVRIAKILNMFVYKESLFFTRYCEIEEANNLNEEQAIVTSKRKEK